MSEKYFNKFPLITYNNNLAINITERVVVRDFPGRNAYLYYPYDLQNNERPDQLADRIYNDEYMSWIVYLSNGITDPYYDWLMPDDAFNQYLIKKYGNLDRITAKVAYYRNNWYNDPEVITTSEFNSLPDITKQDPFGNTYLDTAKRYYEVVLTGDNVTGYKRRKIDEVLHTNKIVKYTITGNTAFTNNEIVDIRFGYQSNTYYTLASAQVLTVNSTALTVQHTSGFVDTAPDGYNISFSNSYVYGTESAANCTITALTSIANNITEAETIYWTPVTIYEDEFEKNLKNKTIRLIDPSRAQTVAEQAADTLASLL